MRIVKGLIRTIFDQVTALGASHRVVAFAVPRLILMDPRQFARLVARAIQRIARTGGAGARMRPIAERYAAEGIDDDTLNASADRAREFGLNVFHQRYCDARLARSRFVRARLNRPPNFRLLRRPA